MPSAKRRIPRQRPDRRFEKALEKMERMYPSYAIVGQLDDQGQLNTKDDDEPLRFVEQDDQGVWVWVVLQPSLDQVKVRYGSGTGTTGRANKGKTAVKWPIRGGDEVLVDKPQSAAPVITVRLNNAHSPLPKEWDNESILVSLGDQAMQAFNDSGSFLVWNKDNSLTFKQPGGALIQVSADGYLTVIDKDKNALWSDANGWQMITANGSAFKLGEKIQLLSPDDLDIGAKQVTVASTMIVGDATAKQLVILDTLRTAVAAALLAATPADGGAAAFAALQSGLALSAAGTIALKSS